MKHSLYLFCLIVLLSGVSSCKKDTEQASPASPVVGRWTLNRGILSSFPAPYANTNGRAIDLYLIEGIGSTIDVYVDNTFSEDLRINGVVEQSEGTWTFNNNQLTLKYNTGGDPDTYNYTKNKNVEELAATAPVNYTLTLTNPTTNQPADVGGKVQLIYKK